MIDYLNGQFLPHEDARISPDDRGFLFADGVYEVIRFYGGRAFRQERHLARLSASAAGLRFGQTSFPELPDIIATLLERNGLRQADSLVYVQVTRGSAPRTHSFPPASTPLTVYATCKPFAAGAAHPEGMAAIVVRDDRWSRCDLKTTNLLANTLAYQQAKEAGADEAIFSRGGNVLEGSHTNIGIVLRGVLVTPARSNLILAGITREAVLEAAVSVGISVAERVVSVAELFQAQEVIAMSTTLEVTAVVRLNGAAVGSGKEGEATGRLRAGFRGIVTG